MSQAKKWSTFLPPRCVLRGGKAYRQSSGFKQMIRERDNHTCQICGEPGHEVDHIIPYVVSGETKPETSRVLCVKCNRATRRQRKDTNPYITLEGWYDYLDAEIGKC